MYYLLIVIISITLFSAVIISAFVYFSPEEAVSAGQGPLIASEMTNLISASQSFYEVRGTYPLSLADLNTEVEYEPIPMLKADFVISNGIACIAMPYLSGHNKTLENASFKIPGSVVTDTCGNSGIMDRRFLAVSLDGTNQPVATPFLG